MRLRRIDAMLIKGFIPPFLVSFLLALFVLVMQTLWLYIDDIIGKGAGTLIIIEFLSYLSFSLIPLALPIGILLAGVFLFGNLGERYELSSMKSAGISLFRIMKPLLFFAACVTIFSYICSEYINPKTNLKFMTRLHDLRRQKPTLSLEEGVFNEDFYGYVIRIGKKELNGRDISDILIYDHSEAEGYRSQHIISARKGQMYVSENDKFFVMLLDSGMIYQDPGEAPSANSVMPFIRTSFRRLTKVFDLHEFKLDRSDENLFISNQRMKNTHQLAIEIDSMDNQISRNVIPVFSRFKKFQEGEERIRNRRQSSFAVDTVLLRFKATIENRIFGNAADELDSLNQVWQIRNDSTYFKLYTRAISLWNSETSKNLAYKESIKSLLVRRAKFQYELYLKYSLAFVCIIFIFVGAPLGAIVRKGGYGYPLILCILVFVAYILLNTFCKRLTESLSISGMVAAWIPCLIMAIPAIFLTRSAMRDRSVIADFRQLLDHFMNIPRSIKSPMFKKDPRLK